MISAEEFVHCLKKNGIHAFTGVPCSFFQAAINRVLDDDELRYTMVPNEGSALSLAIGASLAGADCAVMIQNSGFGNLVNPLTSLSMIYRVPVLVFMSGRAYGVADEPQHEIIGKTMGPVLDAMGVKHQDLPDDLEKFEDAIEEATQRMRKEKAPFFFFVRKGSIDDYVPKAHHRNSYPLKRIEAIQVIIKNLKGNEYLIATTGKPSRELFNVSDGSKNFYMQGSMGHAASIGLGAALNQPKKKIVVLDGDGAILMHMGILSSVGFYKPKNFYHIVLDNESYETTGDQDTTSPSTDFTAIAKACGYAQAAEAVNEKDLSVAVKRFEKEDGPFFLRVKINRQGTPDIPRISSKYSSAQIAENFKDQLFK